MKIIEPYGPPTTEQLTARHLARSRTPMTSTRLRHALAASGYRLGEEEVSRAIARHPAFTERSDGRGDLFVRTCRPQTVQQGRYGVSGSFGERGDLVIRSNLAARTRNPDEGRTRT